MGLCKNIHTKIGEGTFVSAAEKRFGGYEVKKSPTKKKVVPPKNNKEFVTDMLDGLL